MARFIFLCGEDSEVCECGCLMLRGGERAGERRDSFNWTRWEVRGGGLREGEGERETERPR